METPRHLMIKGWDRKRKARHRRIESTLRYDHSSDEMVREYFRKYTVDSIDSLKPEEKVRAMLDRMLSGEIDRETFKTSIDILMSQRHREKDIAYI